MRKGEIIKGYKILKDFDVNGGQSMTSFASKGGKEYFIKKFLEPKYPIEGAPGSAKTKNKKRKRCKSFEDKHRTVNKKIASKVALGGNLVFAVDFFREGTTYYKINEKINNASLSVKDIAKFPFDNRLLILKTVAHSLKILHSLEIVHGDIKPDNVLIKKTKLAYTSKLIDFDCSYFSGLPPVNVDDIVGDIVYYSPELGSYILNPESDKTKSLTVKSDIFALGILYHQYIFGNLPPFISKKDTYLWQYVNDKNTIIVNSPKIPEKLNILITEMLSYKKENRPSISEVFTRLKTIDKPTYTPPPPKPKEDKKPSTKGGSGGLKGKFLDKIKKGTKDSKKEEKTEKPKLKGTLLKKKKK